MATEKVAGNKENLQKFPSTNSVFSGAKDALRKSAVNENTYQQSEKRLHTWSDERFARLKRPQ